MASQCHCGIAASFLATVATIANKKISNPVSQKSAVLIVACYINSCGGIRNFDDLCRDEEGPAKWHVWDLKKKHYVA